jgi:tetratricopeptide (TPR) repeat protein
MSNGAPAARAVADLARRADDLQGDAPDQASRAHASFYRGLIADVLGDGPDGPVRAAEYYRRALDTDDEFIRSFALRHLGALADDAGDHDQAVAMWREATRLRQRAGHVPGVLAQLILLAGDLPTGEIVDDWADGLGIHALVARAAAIEPEVARDPR